MFNQLFSAPLSLEDVFLKYLAVNGIIQNWDIYGLMVHNFYLYNDPDTEKTAKLT
jgi:spore coat protein CotH